MMSLLLMAMSGVCTWNGEPSAPARVARLASVSNAVMNSGRQSG
jgi:hypothetical protein